MIEPPTQELRDLFEQFHALDNEGADMAVVRLKAGLKQPPEWAWSIERARLLKRQAEHERRLARLCSQLADSIFDYHDNGGRP